MTKRSPASLAKKMAAKNEEKSQSLTEAEVKEVRAIQGQVLKQQAFIGAKDMQIEALRSEKLHMMAEVAKIQESLDDKVMSLIRVRGMDPETNPHTLFLDTMILKLRNPPATPAASGEQEKT